MSRENAPAGCRLFLVIGIGAGLRAGPTGPNPELWASCVMRWTDGDGAASMRVVAEFLGRPAPVELEAAGRVLGLVVVDGGEE